MNDGTYTAQGWFTYPQHVRDEIESGLTGRGVELTTCYLLTVQDGKWAWECYVREGTKFVARAGEPVRVKGSDL